VEKTDEEVEQTDEEVEQTDEEEYKKKDVTETVE